VYGDGEQTRCFTDVRDTVTAITRLMETPFAVGETFNIGNSREITIGGLARKVIKMTRSRSEIRYLPYDAVYGGDSRTCADASRMPASCGG
jgi:UDP-glucose 4-epimerase